MKKLSDQEIRAKLDTIPDWETVDNALQRTVEFKTYMKSIEFINLLAEEAEKMVHHPDMQVGWCRITVNFSTHDMGGITLLDFEMAKKTDKLIEAI